MIDTHCHLEKEDYENLEQVIKNMEGNIMIASGYDSKSNRNVIDLVNKYDNIYGTIGIHPTEYDSMNEEELKFIEENLNNKKIVGVGEIGLDYYWDADHKEIQKEYFIKQIQIAKKYNKVIVIHSREACQDTYDILKEYTSNNKIVLHCYSYTKEMAKEFKKLGVKFGIGGVLTFKNANKLKETVEILDMEHILLETDSPYLSPEPFRGKTNEPKNIELVAKKIAEIKDLKYEEVLLKTTENATQLFDLKG